MSQPAGASPDPRSAPFAVRLESAAADTERLLARLLGASTEPGEIGRPERLMAAMRHATLGGGKRLRPFLVLESARLFSVPPDRAMMVGAALEAVHCYSLAHDDLPAMDNDDLRRGQPTVHRAFDEATAILAGDALLTLAFDLLAREQTHPDPAVRIELVLSLARASGLGGMVGGQMLDLDAEGRFADGRPRALQEADIIGLQSMKTGALLHFGCAAGAILGGAGREHRRALDRFGHALGKAFQIADDLLDAEGDTATLGKAAGKDAAAGKGTLVGILGVDGARTRLAALVGEAESALDLFGAGAETLRETARFVAARRS